MTGPGDEELFAFLEGELSPERAMELDAWASSEDGRGRLESARALLATLRVSAPGNDHDLVAAVDAKLNARQRRPVLWGVAGLAAALALTFVVREAPEWRVKGSAAAEARWTGVEFYRVAQGAPSRLGDTLGGTEGVLVAYVNGDVQPFTHLMVFAVDEQQRVYWYYPAWDDPRSDPESIPIEGSRTPIELHERITHQLPVGRLEFHAVFSRTPLRVSAVERALAQDNGLPDDVVEQRVVVEVR